MAFEFYDPGWSDSTDISSYTAGDVTGGGADWLSGISGLANTALNLYGGVKMTDAKANLLNQYDPATGLRYVAGQPITTTRTGAMIVSPVLLILMLGAVFLFVEEKK